MLNFIFRSAAWQLVAQADFTSKLVLLLLFSASVICVAIIVYKSSFLKKEIKAAKIIFTGSKSATVPDDFLKMRTDMPASLGGQLLSDGFWELKSFLRGATGLKKLSPVQLSQLDVALNHGVDRVLMEAEQLLPILGICAAVSPLLGLFGTIWGLIHSFINISQSKVADISVVAPGIAEALITTLAGLFVAIPAMVAFHFLSNELRKLEHFLLCISDRFYEVVKQTLS